MNSSSVNLGSELCGSTYQTLEERQWQRIFEAHLDSSLMRVIQVNSPFWKCFFHGYDGICREELCISQRYWLLSRRYIRLRTIRSSQLLAVQPRDTQSVGSPVAGRLKKPMHCVGDSQNRTKQADASIRAASR